jgi:hypothetical protein
VRNLNNPTDIRKAMLANGFEPIPNLDKHPYMKGWQTVAITDAEIDRWSRKRAWLATGSRLTHQSQLDVDINDALIDAIIARWEIELPHLWADKVLERGTDASVKVSFFFRLASGTPPIMRSRGWRNPAEPGKIHKVEVLSGPGRQAGVFGPHDLAKGSSYVWKKGSDDPTNTRLDELPVLDVADATRLLAIADEMMAAAGWEEVVAPFVGGNWIYDITPDMVFECEDGVTRTLAEMKADVDADGMRCSASFFEPGAVRTDRCWAHVFELDNGDVTFIVHDFDTGTHGLKHTTVEDIGALLAGEPIAQAWAEANPPQADRAAKRGGAGRMGPAGPLPANAADTRADELLDQFVFWPEADKSVLSLYGTGRSFKNFQIEQAPFTETVQWVTPAGNPTTKARNPADIWKDDMERVTVGGMSCRPDVATRLFTDDVGQVQLNTYWPPSHVTRGGSSAALWELIDHLAPDPADRKYLTQLLAHKVQHPGVPGPAVIMVAQDQHGTGRGTFFRLLEELFGPRNVGEVPYSYLSGRDSQGQYNDWLESVVAYVNETEDIGEQSKARASRNTWARLKQYADPRARMMRIVRKGIPSTVAQVCCTLFIAMNDIAEIWMHETDRRFFVFYNGPVMTVELARRANNAIASPADVAALHRELMAMDVSAFDPYAAPPVTAAKQEMADIGRNDVERAFDIVIDHLKKTGCELFSMFQIINGMAAMGSAGSVHGTHGFQYWDNWEREAEKLTRKKAARVGVKNGPNYYMMVEARRYGTYAWTKEAAARWTGAASEVVRAAVLRAGPLDKTFASTVGTLADQMAR